MITRIIKITIDSVNTDDFKQFITLMKDNVSTIGGCQHIDILNNKEDKNIFFMYTIWETEAMFRCPVIGFCLTASEQKQIIKKTHRKIKKLSDIDIHEILVRSIKENSPV